ncbi:MAG: PAS domain S-box protein [Methanoregulaceae archaeon]
MQGTSRYLSNSRRITILYVDDEGALLTIVKTFLELSGQFQVDISISVSDALEKLNRQSYDAIISDYDMPEMDGIEFLNYIRARFGELPFILFTGKGREEVVINALNRGADFYLQKGGEPKSQFAELEHKIKQAVERNWVKEELRKSEQRYRNVVEDQTEFICRFTPDGTHIFVNEAYCRYFGKKREDIIGRRFIPEIPNEDLAAVREHFSSITRDQPVATIEHRIILSDGQVRWQRWSDRAIFDMSGLLTEYQSVGRDITDRKQSEALLRASEARYRSLFERVPVGLYRMAPDGEILDANPALVALLGYPDRASLATVKMPDLYVDPEARREWHASIGRDGKTCDFEVRFCKYDGTIIWVQGTCTAILDDRGQILNYKGSLEDITKRKLAEDELRRRNEELHAAYEELTTTEEELRQNYDELSQAERNLRESERRYRTIFENTGTATVLIEEDTTICLANTEFEHLSGYSKQEIEGKKSWKEFVVAEDRDRMVDQHRLRRESPASALRHYEFRFLTKSGDIRNSLLTIDIIPDSKRSVASLTDITDKKCTEEELKKAVKNLTLLSSITRHDILNQITALQGYLELAKMRSGNPEKMADILKKLEIVIGTIQSQIEFTRVYQNLGIQKPQWQEIHTAIPWELVPDWITMHINLPEIGIYADPMLKKVFINLLDNSLRHGGNVTTVKISSELSQDALHIYWEDNGRGIAPGEKERIFELGYGKHTGLGLFFVREVLAITGITICETGEPGKGARFEISIPEGGYQFL